MFLRLFNFYNRYLNTLIWLGTVALTNGIICETVYATGKNDRKGNQCYCSCVKCHGCWIPRSTYFLHQHQQHARINAPTVLPSNFFDENFYSDSQFQKPLYEGSKTSVLEAIAKHFYVFSVNSGLSKSALSDTLKCEKSSLPQPNNLPVSFNEAKDFIKPLLIPLDKYHACINDCMIYRGINKDADNCPVCSEPRLQNGFPRKTFRYMSLRHRLIRWFGTFNLCKLLYADKLSTAGVLQDFTDGSIYQSWYNEGGVFHGKSKPLCVPLSLFTDGVNPNKHMTNQKSMWPLILTWITLPRDIRQLLGPMLLMGIIPSGINGSEPKSLEPYLELLTDELLSLTEFPVINAYLGAPVNIKVALLQFLCDIPAFSKVLYLAGHGAVRSCPYCKEIGHYCKHLRKTIHVSNRSFLRENHDLRHSSGFASLPYDNNKENVPYSSSEEAMLRARYEIKPNKTQKAKFQKETGFRGRYTLMKLPYHNRLDQMQPDGMHTLADFISHVFDMLCGKHDSENVRECEKSFGRFPEVWIKNSASVENSENCSKRRKVQNVENVHPKTPWSLTKQQIKEADDGASMIVYSHEQDISPGPHFSKPWTLRTMNSKLQFVTSGALEWCIRGFLPWRQETTLGKVIDVIRRMISPTLQEHQLQSLQDDTHLAFSLFERDFPVSMQNLVTHLIHHLVDGFPKFGPLYGRWLFPYERANGWITRQCLKKGAEESTVMETYTIYDWCTYLILSKKFKPEDSFLNDNAVAAACKRISDNAREEFNFQFIQSKNQRKSELTNAMILHLQKFYKSVLKMDVHNMNGYVTENRISMDVLDNCGRSIKFTGKDFKGGSKNSAFVKIPNALGAQFGKISMFLTHNVNFTLQNWAIVEVFALAEDCNGLLKCDTKVIGERLIHVSLLSKPHAFVQDVDCYWILKPEV